MESAESAAHEARPNEIIGSTREEVERLIPSFQRATANLKALREAARRPVVVNAGLLQTVAVRCSCSSVEYLVVPAGRASTRTDAMVAALW